MKFNDLLKKITIKIMDKKNLSNLNKIVLDKSNNYANMSIQFSPFLIKAVKDKHIELLSQKIKHFLIVMESKCENFDSTFFLNNFKKTFFKIEDLDKKMMIV